MKSRQFIRLLSFGMEITKGIYITILLTRPKLKTALLESMTGRK